MTLSEALGTIRRIGPVTVNVGNHTAAWTGVPDQYGTRELNVNGTMREPESGRALLEYVNNADARTSFGEAVGVLTYIDAWGEYSDLRGWALLSAFTYTDGPADSDSDIGWGPFSMSGHMVEGREIVVVRSARPKANDFALSARSIVVQPLWGPDAAGTPFLTDPGGTAFSREYDPRTDYDPAAPATTGRRLRIHEGTVT